MNKEQKEIYDYEPIYSQSDIDEWIRLAEERFEEIRELKAENAKLKDASKNMNALCYIEANLTPDCNPYYCVRKLKFEIKELKTRIEELEEKK